MTSEQSDSERRRTAIAMLLKQRQSQHVQAQPERSSTRDWPDLIPLTSAQQRVLAADDLAGADPLFTLSFTIPVASSADDVESTLRECIERHAALRTQIVVDDDGLDQQRVLPSSAIPVTRLRMSGADADVTLAELADAERQRRFDVRAEPLLRAHIVENGDDACVLVVSLHHLIADAVSLQLIIRELESGEHVGEASVDYPDLALVAADDPSADDGLLRETAERLRDAPHPLSPVAFPDDGASHTVISAPLEIDAAIFKRIRESASEMAVGDSGIMLAGLLAVLRRFSGTDELVFGIPVHGRTQPGSETVVGLFVNTYVARVSVSERETFGSLARAARSCLDATIDGRAPSLPDVLRLVYTGQSNLPRLGVSFNRFDIPSRDRPLGKLDYPMAIGNDVPLVLQVGASAESYDAVLLGSASTYGPAMLRDLATSVVDVICQGLDAPETPIGMLGRGVESPAAKPVTMRPCRTIRERVAEVAARHPDRIAAEHEDGATLTYAELFERVEATRATIAGVPMGTVIAVTMKRSMDLMAAIVAAIDSHMLLLLPTDISPARRAELLELISPAAWLAGGGEYMPGERASDRIGCGGYLAFTSGTTGKPRVIMIDAATLATHLDSVIEELDLSPSTRYLAATQVGFDPVYEQLLAPLLVGGTVVLKSDRQWPPERLAERFRALRVTDANLSTAMFSEWVNSGADLRLPAHVRGVVPGGATLSRRDAAAFLDVNPFVVLRNAYGPTETVITASMTPVGVDDLEPGAAPSIGRPLPGRTLQPCDADLRPASVLSSAELLIGGPTAAGYWGDPRRTALHFIPDASSTSGGRCYRSGDLVRMRSSGRSEFVGRRDRQLNLFGVRLEAEEIEEFAARIPDVTSAAIVVDELDHSKAVLWIEADDRCVTVARVREHLGTRFSLTAIPGTIVIHAELPRTAGQKIDHTKLRARRLPDTPVPSGSAVAASYELRTVVEAFQTVLNFPCDAESDFFSHGGNSLSGLRLARVLGERLGRPVSLADVIAAPTPARLAARITDAVPADDEQATARLARTGEQVMLLPEQISLLLESELRDSLAPIVIVPIELTPDLTFDRLAEALTDVITRHEGLRLTIDGKFATVADVDPNSVRANLEPVLADTAAAGREIVREWAAAFDVARASFVARILRLAEARVLLLLAHHAVFDERSLGVVLADLTKALRDSTTRTEPAVQFTDAVRRRATLPVFARDDTAENEVPLPGGDPDAPDVIQVPVRLAPGKLNELARAYMTTPLVVVAAYGHAALCEWSGVDRVRIGVPIDTRAADEDVVGSFLSVRHITGPRGKVDADSAVRWFHNALNQVIAEAQSTTMSAERIPNAMVAATVAAQTMIPDGAPLKYRTAVPFGIPSGLLLVAESSDDDTSLLIRAAGSTVHEDDLNRLASILGELLHDGRSERLLAAEADDARDTWLHGTAPASPSTTRSVPQRLLIECERRPDGIALYDGDRIFTRGEFLRLVRRAAAVLAEHGVRDGERVAVHLGTSVDLVVAANAAMWLGAAYVPIDPALPADRRERILSDVDPCVVVSADAPANAPGSTWLQPDELSAGEGEIAGPAPACPNRAAHVVYTSGSTGLPKGVCIGESALATFLDWHLGRVVGSDILIAISSPGFDLSVVDMVWPSTGGAVAVLEPRVRFDPALIARQLRTTIACTVGTVGVGGTPSIVNAVHRMDPGVFAGLSVMLGGEPVPPGLVEGLAEHGARVVIGYGPTETTVLATATDPLPASPDHVTLGSALGTVELEVVGSALHPVATGHVGELLIGGPTVAIGYFCNPRATALRFIPASGGRRRYRTGDLVRERRGGLEYMGREDRQVKVNGVRVELGEIEQLLRRHDVIEAARVVPSGRTAGLVAFIVAAAGANLSAISAGLRRGLPVGVSARVVSVERLPLSANGKIDDDALLAAMPTSPTAADRQVADLERVLMVTAGHVLGIDSDEIAPEENLFALGGTSLSVIELGESLHELFDVRLPLREMYDDPTIDGIGTCLRRHVSDADARAAEFVPYLREPHI